jgi:hypothetical protein
VRMGLLDDAIREHLELKRRRGADPGEVAREQREALDPVPRERAAATEDELLVPEQSVQAEPPLDLAPPPLAQDEGVAPNAPDPTEQLDAAAVGETAELDMRTVLGGDEDHEQPAEDARVPRSHDVDTEAAQRPDAAAAQEDSLEWEVPADAAQAAQTVDEHDEDVLEETPDFLRDTPEQERLWFEQRPPRDFDFDK